MSSRLGVRDEIVSHIGEDPRFLTIVVGSPLINPRTLCFKFPNREDRNSGILVATPVSISRELSLIEFFSYLLAMVPSSARIESDDF